MNEGTIPVLVGLKIAQLREQPCRRPRRRGGIGEGLHERRKLVIASLCVTMAMTMDAMNGDALAFVAKVLEKRDVGRASRRDQALALGQRFRLVE
jgi:hypothetical protein